MKDLCERYGYVFLDFKRTNKGIDVDLALRDHTPITKATPRLLLELWLREDRSLIGGCYLYMLGEEVDSFGIGELLVGDASSALELLELALVKMQEQDFAYRLRRVRWSRDVALKMASAPINEQDDREALAYELEAVLDRYGYASVGPWKIEAKR